MSTVRRLSLILAIITAVVGAILWVLSAIFPGEGYSNAAIWLLASSALFITPYTNLSDEKAGHPSRGKFDYLMESLVSAFYAAILAAVVYMATAYYSSPQNVNSGNSVEIFGLFVLGLSFLTSFCMHAYSTLVNLVYVFRAAK